MRAVEKATSAEIRALPEPLRSSALAKAALNLARRLDDRPADSVAVLIVRELRMTLDALHRRQPEGLGDEVDRFLERIAAPDVGHAED